MTQEATEAPQHETNGPMLRRLARLPLLWALLCAVVALPWHLAGAGDDFPPFLLGLVGGWLCGNAFVLSTFTMENARRGAMVHVAGAVVFGAALYWLVFEGNSVLEDAPELLKKALYPLQMAAIPAVGWIWLALLSRITALASRPSARNRDNPPTAPAWEPGSAGTAVHFRAIPMTVAQLTWIIVGVTSLVGAVFIYVLVTFDWLLETGSSTVVILAATALGVPAYLLLRAALGRKTVACSVQFSRDLLRIDTGTTSRTIALANLDHLSWRSDGSYARVEARGPGMDVSLIVGLARVPKATLPNLPPLSQQTTQRLVDAGLVGRRGRRPALVQFDAGSSRPVG